MKKLSDDDILKWLKSDEKANFNAKNRSKLIKKYPKPNQITRETLRKILKGKIKIDAEIDLHGMDRFEAREKIENFIFDSFLNGNRYINIITGKGSGVIRRVVQDYLDDEKSYKFIISFSNAHRKQGGDGAFVLHLRKKETIG
tara:strand:+ start:1036 stop:1464 length:429 start_codon:yes stop_codon:yes gene_type:complete